MAYGDYIYYWRHTQPQFVSRAGLARYLGVGVKMVESIEQNVRSPGPAVRDRLEQLIALGKQRADDERPAYQLAVARRDEVVWLADAHGRPGIFTKRGLADSACGWLLALGVPNVVGAPLWPLAVGLAAAEPPPHPDGAQWLDEGQDAEAIATRTLQWMAAGVPLSAAQVLKGPPALLPCVVSLRGIVQTGHPLARLKALDALRAEVDAVFEEAAKELVRAAFTHQATTWDEVGRALGVSKATAQRRYSDAVGQRPRGRKRT